MLQNQFHANRDARQKLVELIESSQLRRVAVAFLYHLILDNAKLLSYWAGHCHVADITHCRQRDSEGERERFACTNVIKT